MRKESPALEAFLKTEEYFLPSVSIDNIIFGFHENQLKVLLLQLKKNNKWKLPGGFIQWHSFSNHLQLSKQQALRKKLLWNFSGM